MAIQHINAISNRLSLRLSQRCSLFQEPAGNKEPKTVNERRAKLLANFQKCEILFNSMPPAPLHGSVIREVFLCRFTGNRHRKEAACNT